MRAVFVRGLDARCVVVGMDTRFGYRNSGDVSTLADLGEQFGFEVVALDDVGEGERFSSTVVRGHLRAGEVAEAARILGRPHRVVGTVVHGNHRGKGAGLPHRQPVGRLARAWCRSRASTPAGSPGSTCAEGERDRTMPAAISVGTNPTFETHDRRTVEAYVLDRDDLDLYDERVMVEFTAHIRPTLKFESVDELLEAMGQDVARCRELLTKIVPA